MNPQAFTVSQVDGDGLPERLGWVGPEDALLALDRNGDGRITNRTIAGQIEYWAKIGRAALDNPDLPVSFVAESLASLTEPRGEATPFVPRSSQKPGRV